MKKVLVVSALSLVAATPAFASKARLQALQKAEFLKDSQTVFLNPAHINTLGKYVTAEFGGGTNTAAPKAEGGIFANEMGGNMGLYLGHLSANQQSLRAVNGFENQNNPVEVFYGKDAWGASLAVSNSKDKTTDTEEQSVAARFGWDRNGTEFFGTVEAFASSENAAGDEFTGSPYVNLGYEQEFGTNYLFAKMNWGSAETDFKAAATKDQDIDDLGFEVGVLSRKIKNIYYGASISYATRDIGKDITAVTLPVFVGLEMDVTSWMVARASIAQSVLLSSTENENLAAPGDEKVTNKNDTTVAAGLGLKYNSFILDGVIAGSTTGDINGTDFLTQASLTYSF
jgi:hypothetical protein